MTLTMTPANTPQMNVAVQAQMTVRQQLSGMAQHLLSLPAINNPQLPSLAVHIQAVRGHAKDYLGPVSTQMDAVNTQLAAYGNALQQTCNQVLALLRGSGGTSPPQVQTMLVALQAAGTPVGQALAQMALSIASFDNNITADARNLLGDQQLAQQLMAADQARMQALMQQLNSLRAELEDKQREEVIVGIFTLGIGAAIMELTGYVQSTESDINAAQQQGGMLSQQMAQLGATTSALTAFTNGTAVLAGLTQTLQHDWQTANAMLNELTQKSVPSAFLQAYINALMADWNELMGELPQLQQ